MDIAGDFINTFIFGRSHGKKLHFFDKNGVLLAKNGIGIDRVFIDDAKNMKELTTKQAYKEYITSGKIAVLAEDLGIEARACSVHRNQVKNDIFPSVDLMEKRLTKSGYIVLQEKLWIK